MSLSRQLRPLSVNFLSCLPALPLYPSVQPHQSHSDGPSLQTCLTAQQVRMTGNCRASGRVSSWRGLRKTSTHLSQPGNVQDQA